MCNIICRYISLINQYVVDINIQRIYVCNIFKTILEKEIYLDLNVILNKKKCYNALHLNVLLLWDNLNLIKYSPSFIKPYIKNGVHFLLLSPLYDNFRTKYMKHI